MPDVDLMCSASTLKELLSLKEIQFAIAGQMYNRCIQNMNIIGCISICTFDYVVLLGKSDGLSR